MVSAKSSKVSAGWTVGLVVSAKFLRSRPGSLGLDQVDQVSGNQVGLGQGDQWSASPTPVHLPPGSRAGMLDVPDEFLMMGVSRPPWLCGRFVSRGVT